MAMLSIFKRECSSPVLSRTIVDGLPDCPSDMPSIVRLAG